MLADLLDYQVTFTSIVFKRRKFGLITLNFLIVSFFCKIMRHHCQNLLVVLNLFSVIVDSSGCAWVGAELPFSWKNHQNRSRGGASDGLKNR